MESFRRKIIAAIRAALEGDTARYVHFVYSPELIDPLTLLDDAKRETALIRPPNLRESLRDSKFPRLITFDCRRVASYMFETSDIFDDPLFEASISQTYAEVINGDVVDLTVINENTGPSVGAACGWIVSRETATELAARIARNSYLLHPSGVRHWIRWNNPIHISILWQTLTSTQKQVLLSDARWIAFDLTRRLRTYKCDEESREIKDGVSTFKFIDEQWARYEAAPVVGSLVEKMIAADDAVAEDIVERLYRHLKNARYKGLHREDRRLYAMTLVHVHEGADQVKEWAALVERVLNGETKMRDGLADLSEEFWNYGTVQTDPLM